MCGSAIREGGHLGRKVSHDISRAAVLVTKNLAESGLRVLTGQTPLVTLVAHSDLPTFAHLREHGHELLSLERAMHQDIRELHIGFLNMMPDAALQATERQFIRLVGSCNRIARHNKDLL